MIAWKKEGGGVPAEVLDKTAEAVSPVKKKIWPWICAAAAAFVLLAAVITGLVLWNQNRFTLAFTLKGERNITLTYGEHYEEPGWEASFSGSIFFREPQAVQVIPDGRVDESTLGTYLLRYRAEYALDFFGRRTFVRTLTRRVTVADNQAPVITLVTDPDAYTIPGQIYQEEGFTAADNYDGDLTAQVQTHQQNGIVYYTVADSSGNETTVQRQIYYYDPIPPELTLKGELDITIWEKANFKEPGYEAADNLDGDITDKVVISGEVNSYVPGTYTLTYSITDSYNNTVTAQRTVRVVALPPMPSMPEGSYGTPTKPNGRVIYLTFDDGPGPYTAKLLDILDKYGVKATFFVVNTGYTYLLPRMAAAGHTIGVHSVTHKYSQIYASESAYFNDVKKMQDIIYSYTGQTPTIVRFPGGSSNTVSRFNPGIMTRLTDMLEDMGYRYFDWSVDSMDAGGASSSSEVYYNVINAVSRRQVSIVLQHDIKGFSVNAVESIIQWGLANGYTFLPLDANSPRCEHRLNN